jgi:hypothetical protein
MSIKINLSERHLYLFSSEKLSGTYRIAIGKPHTPSPVGKWKIANKSILTPGTVYGTRWLGLNIDNYGIHGNNNIHSIGTAASLGCIRMYNEEVEHVFSLVSIGTPVEIATIISGSGFPLPPYTPPAQAKKGGAYTPSAGKKIYIIKQGDTLWSIAKKNGISIDTILSLNPKINPQMIFPGHVLYLP